VTVLKTVPKKRREDLGFFIADASDRKGN